MEAVKSSTSFETFFLQILANPKCQSGVDGCELWEKKTARRRGDVLTAASEGHSGTRPQNSNSQLCCQKTLMRLMHANA